MEMNLRKLVTLCALMAIPFTVLSGESAKFAYCDITKPEFFPILPWDALHGMKNEVRTRPENSLESIADCNFNMAGFVHREDLSRCKKLGLGALLFPFDPDFSKHSWNTLSDEGIDQKIKQLVHDAGNNPALMGYFVTDEPGVKDFPALAKAVAAVKKYAPGKLAYINLLPDYATIGAPDKSQLGTENYTEYLERFVNEVHPQLISYDNYRVEMSEDFKHPEKAESYFRNLLEVRRVGLKYNLPYLNIVTGNQIRPYSTPPSPANFAFQAYTTLAAGYRGVTWFTYFQRGYHYAAIDTDGTKSQTWFYLQEVNRQVATLAPIMSKLKSTGVYFSKAPYPNLPLLPGNLVQSVECESPLMIGEFKANDGNLYAMVVNLSLERSAKFSLKTKDEASTIQIVSTVDRSLSPIDEKNGLWLVAGQGALLKLGKK
ncbi:MAG: hypothetical protein JWM68_2676 [Verrucomicrobiales bacterium]|nr:hypothetical protein [Verrucomicrobiales bacterium]